MYIVDCRDLSNNLIQTIESGAFDGLNATQQIWLQNNLIKFWPPISTLAGLQLLDLSNNQIESMAGAAFDGILPYDEIAGTPILADL